MDTESLIAHLSGGLAPADRDAFRRAAETALATSPQMLGSRLDFSRYRAAVAQLFSPTNIRGSHHGVGAGRKPSKLVAEPPLAPVRDCRRFRSVR
jgi:hypothetical protein